MKIRLYLLGKKAFLALNDLSNFQYRISEVIIGRDKNIFDDYSIEIKNFCKKNKIFYSYYKISDGGLKTNHVPDYGVAVGWRWLIRPGLHKKLFIFHDSLLPKYRGFSPLVTALINGDEMIGATCLLASEKFDQGSIIDQTMLKIAYPIKIEEAIIKIGMLYSKLLPKLIKKLELGEELEGDKQNEKLASYSVWRDEDDYKINWNDEASVISRFIDAVGYPYQGARSSIGEQEIIINECEVVEDVFVENRDVGKVLFRDSYFPIVICGKGLLKLTSISDINGNPIKFPDKFRYRLK